MREIQMRRILVIVAVMALAVAACGDDAGTTTADGHGHIDDVATTTTSPDAHDEGHDEGHDDGHDEGHEMWFGQPAEAADAARVILIAGGDDFRFDPETVEVRVGEIVTFRVTNTGIIPHDFFLGDEHMQEEHEEEMAAMATDGAMDHDDPNAVILEPGETADLTFQFLEAGTIQFGCHQPGHFPAGMVGTLIINP